MKTADWGSQGEYVNSGRVDLGKLVIAKLRAAWTVRLASAHHPMEDNGRDTVFITFGAMSADSSLLTPSRRIPTGESYSRYVTLMPMHYDYFRLSHLLQSLSETCPDVDKDLTYVAYGDCITVGTYPTKHPEGEPSKNVTPSKARA